MTKAKTPTREQMFNKIFTHTPRDYKGKDEVVLAEVIKEQIGAELEQKIFLTSLEEVNKILGGFKSGDLITMSGISGNGKTELL